MTSNIKIKKINSEISSIIIDEQKTYNSLSFKNLKDLLDALKKGDKDKRVKKGVNWYEKKDEVRPIYFLYSYSNHLTLV